VGVRESTRVSYDGSFERHILPELGKIPLNDLERKRVKKFVELIKYFGSHCFSDPYESVEYQINQVCDVNFLTISFLPYFPHKAC
jgi:Phage integrase, N-terminal SAM-like domain